LRPEIRPRNTKTPEQTHNQPTENKDRDKDKDTAYNQETRTESKTETTAKQTPMYPATKHEPLSTSRKTALGLL